MVSARLIFSSCDPREHVPYAFRRIRRHSSQVSLYPTIRIWLFDLSGQSVSLPSFSRRRKYKNAAWIAIGLLTAVLWSHGNPGGWQFSYRYAIILLPWMFLLLAGNGSLNISVIEVSLFIVSVAINAVATYQFLWTTRIHP